MAKRLTESEWLNRAKAVHGDKYDYSQAVYEGVDRKVLIICPVHGAFEQTPYKHMQGRGCPACGRLKQKETCREKYGGESPMCSKEVRAKAADTLVQRYGTDNVFKLDAFQEKARDTNEARYGCRNAAGSEIVRQRIEETMLERYGAKTPYEVPEIKAKAVSSIEERYGGAPIRDPEVLEKMKETNRERYGVDFPLESADVRVRASQSLYEHYGVENVMYVPSVVSAVSESKRKNGTFGTSSPEEILYSKLVKVFGEEDVTRQYKSGTYGFHADFHVGSRDLYIELNAHWSHGGHWFDAGSKADRAVLAEWEGKDTGFYRNAIQTWSQRDVAKRESARASRLNYVVFWSNDLTDADLWFSMGCPNGTDWEQEYSWLR